MHVPHPARRTRIRRLGAAVLVATGAFAVPTACSSQADTVTSSSTHDSAYLAVADAWVKAAPSGMTGAFATLTNDGGDDIRLTSVTTERATTVELHETVSDGAGGMTMRPRKGGFTIKARGSHQLAPGGDHIMLMGLTGPFAPGEQIRLVLHLSDGSTKTMTALVKDFAGADEKYAGSGSSASPSGTPSMDGMSGMGSGSDG